MLTPPSDPEITPSQSPIRTTSLASRMTNVFATPGEVFDEVKASPPSTANWLVPAVALILVGWLGAWAVFSQPAIKQQLSKITERAIQKQIQKGNLSKAQSDAAMRSGQKWAGIGTKISSAAAPPLLAFCSPFWWGLIFWLLGNKMMKGDFDFMKGVEVAGLGNVIAVLASVVTTLLFLTFGSLFAAPSLALLVKDYDPNNPVHASLTIFNLMHFWLLGVRAVGLSRLARVTFGKAAAWVFGLWAVWTGLKIGLAFAVKAMMGN
jgi:hypothetical protein